MMFYQIIEKTYSNAKFNAGSKARDDAVRILDGLGFAAAEMTPHDERRADAGRIGKLLGHIMAAREWKKALRSMGSGDVVLIQLPLINHSVYIEKAFASAKKRGLRVIGLVHDLEELRCQLESGDASAGRYAREGAAQRAISDVLIGHTQAMKDYLTEQLGADADRLVVLGIFDYLLGSDLPEASNDGTVAIAGNLKREKAGYVYKLPQDVSFSLYGAGLEGNPPENVQYRGRFSPDEPGLISGAYGLVWDGESADACEGVYGEYLRYNAPHKTSLYLACGLPVIIWDKAALAGLITESGAGLAVRSLSEIGKKIAAVSDDEYAAQRMRAAKLGSKLRAGVKLSDAVNEALDRLGDIFNN